MWRKSAASRRCCYFTQSGGERRTERSIVCFQFVLSHSSPLSLSRAAGSTSSVRPFLRPHPQTPLISFQDRSMTFCYAPQVRAEPSGRPSVLSPFPPRSGGSSGGFCGQTVIRARSRPRRPVDHLVRQVKCLTSEPPPLSSLRSHPMSRAEPVFSRNTYWV